MNYLGTWARKTRRHISTQVRNAPRHVKHGDYMWVGMVENGLDWVRVFGYGLEIGERGCTWAEWA